MHLFYENMHSIILFAVQGQSRGQARLAKLCNFGVFGARVPAVDTGTQYWLTFLCLETSHPDQCPAVDAGIAPQLQSRDSRSAGSQRHVPSDST